jgi:hypothetical protein
MKKRKKSPYIFNINPITKDRIIYRKKHKPNVQKTFYPEPYFGNSEEIPWQVKELKNARSVFLGQHPSEFATYEQGKLEIYAHRKYSDGRTLLINTTINYKSLPELDVAYWRFIDKDTKYEKGSYLDEIIFLDNPDKTKEKIILTKDKRKFVKTPAGIIKQEFKKSQVKRSYLRTIWRQNRNGIWQKRKVRIHIL